MKLKTILILIVGFGLLPIWLALGAIVVLIVLYWNEMGEGAIALPLLFASGVVWSKFTLGIAALTITVYLIVPGTPQRKKLLAGTTFLAFVLAGAGWGATWKYKKDKQAADVIREKAAVVEFVKSNPTVRQTLGPTVDAGSAGITSMDASRWPVRYSVLVKPDDATHHTHNAVVVVTRDGKQATFALKCIRKLRPYGVQGDDPCD